MNTHEEMCEELRSVLLKHPEFINARIMLNFHEPYLPSETWIIFKDKIITETYTATGASVIGLDAINKVNNLDWSKV